LVADNCESFEVHIGNTKWSGLGVGLDERIRTIDSTAVHPQKAQQVICVNVAERTGYHSRQAFLELDSNGSTRQLIHFARESN
jgi:hypothetical protein